MVGQKEKTAIVYIWLSGNSQATPCGKLTMSEQRREERSEFEFGKRYLERPEAQELDPEELSLRNGVFRTRQDFELFSVLRDAAPDGWGRHVLCRSENRAEMTEFEYLVTSDSPDRIGALGFGPNLDGPLGFRSPERGRPVRVDPADLEAMSRAVEIAESDSEIPKEYRQYLIRGSSLGGARPKMTADFNGGKWIAKFLRDDDTFDIPKLEYATMRLAKLAGLTVPDLEFLQIKGKSVFLIKRFDRSYDQKSGDWCRHHMISGLTALTAHERDRGMWGYSDLADFIRKYSPVTKKDLRELFQRMIFNILVSNTDDHLRNHAFLLTQNRSYRLSPLYDVVPDIRETGSEYYLFLKLAGRRRLASLSSGLELAPRFLIPAGEAAKLVEEIRTKVSDWRRVFSDCGFTDKELRRIAPAFHLVCQ